VNDQTTPGIRRIGRKPRVRYVLPNGRSLSDPNELDRVTRLAIPPAWTDVWICPIANGHLQATGRDARGRKQYRYHARWREVRDEVKYARLLSFADALPQIRQRTDADLRRQGLPREKVLAAVVQLLEKTLIRVGNEEYARENGSFGLTTLTDEHATVRGERIRFSFRGKSGVSHAVDLSDRRLARVVKACRDLPGYELFKYVDENETAQTIDSADVNAYMRDVAGQDFTAKDFRTWAGTVLAACELAGARRGSSVAAARRTINAAIEAVAKRLGNTKTVCRKSYVHPAILDAYMNGATIHSSEDGGSPSEPHALSLQERAVVDLLVSRLKAA
jgi:DNA topoisomerase-1